MTISQMKAQGYTIYCQKMDIDMLSLMEKWSKNEIAGKALNSGNPLRSVHLVEYQSKKFIIKNDREIDHRFEKKIINFVFGGFYSRLIKILNNLSPELRAHTADLYYVAEKSHLRQCVDVSAVHEYIEGEPIPAINETNAHEVKTLIMALHRAGLASNDIHPGNFIRTPSGELKIIDLSCKGSIKICQANDILTLRNKYHIDIEGHGWVYNLIMLKERFRRFSRRLRGK